jgi:cell division protein FtsB
MTTEVHSIRETNEALRRDVERLQRDPRTKEAAARVRLNMVRANEVVVPLD